MVRANFSPNHSENQSPILCLDQQSGIDWEEAFETLKEEADTPPKHIYVCAVCNYPITSSNEYFNISGQEQFLFANPTGYSFYIRLFKNAWGCWVSGTPTLEATWFPGHPWRYAHCQQCKRHLGWQYLNSSSAEGDEPHAFFGLISNLICERSMDGP